MDSTQIAARRCAKCTCHKEFRARPIQQQINDLSRIFNLNPNNALTFAESLPPLASFIPDNALPLVAWYAVPSIEALAAKFFPGVTNESIKYCHVVTLGIDKLAIGRTFLNKFGIIGPWRLQAIPSTKAGMFLAGIAQQGDILVIAAQLGKLYRNYSTSRARRFFRKREYGMVAPWAASIVMTHPELLVCSKEQGLICAGEETYLEEELGIAGKWGGVPCLDCDRAIQFFAADCNISDPGFGSASFFVPAPR